jgi:hypothetical protein
MESVMSRIIISLAIALTIASGCQPSGEPPRPSQRPERRSNIEAGIDTWVVTEADPISVVGHGVALNSKGREIDATPEFIIGAQEFYLKSLYQQASERQRDEFKAKQRRLYDSILTQQEQMVVNSALMSWMIDAVKPRNGATLAMNNAWITSIANREMSKDAGAGKPAALTKLLGRLKKEGLLKEGL